eukprot:scaffold179023_cov36-Prasinocladus_malaysianus.AAC.2
MFLNELIQLQDYKRGFWPRQLPEQINVVKQRRLETIVRMAAEAIGRRTKQKSNKFAFGGSERTVR